MTTAELLASVKKNPISFGCGALALALGLAIYFRSSDLPKNAAELEQKAAEGERLAANVRNGAQLSEQLAALTGATKTINERLVRAADLAQNLQYFYKLEAETGTKLIELRQVTNPTGKAVPLSGIAFTVSVRGDYFAVLDFLRRLEGGPHFSRVLSASMGLTGPDRTAPVTLTLGVELLGQL